MKKLIVLLLTGTALFPFYLVPLNAQSLDFGDAPEGALAYPATGVPGQFPTCMTVGPALWIQHTNFGAFFVTIDFENDGNAGSCPLFNPNAYNLDECKNDNDAGLIAPSAFTIVGPVGAEIVAPCVSGPIQPLGNICAMALWGANVDINVQNLMPNQTAGFMNILIDWDQNGAWGGSSICPPSNPAPEHVLVNFPIPNGFVGPLSQLQPPPFLVGPNPGYVWARFTITNAPVPPGWDGSGSFEDGETEDYLLYITTEIIDINDHGDAPDGPYQTLVANGGAGHALDGITFLGGLYDGEFNGQPSPNANGDDLNNLDDEDGVAFTSALVQGQQATINVVANSPCLLNAWCDFNQLNSWSDNGEQIFTNLALAAGLNALTFTVPGTATLGTTFMRFRVNQNGGLTFTGFAADGEVEDYQVMITGQGPPEFDFGDAPEGALAYPASGVIGQFPTCMNVSISGWIQHTNFGAAFAGLDAEVEGNAGFCPLFNPNTYNQDECFGDGDAGLILPGAFTISGLIGAEIVVPCSASSSIPLGSTCTMATWGANIDIQVQNFMPSGTIGFVNVLIDWDQNGIWGGTSQCPPSTPAPEHVLVNYPVPNQFSGPLSALGPPPFVIGPSTGYVWARISITEQQVPLSWNGSGSFEDGETEDYLFLVMQTPPTMDFGDAPDVPYPTLLASNGARHLMSGPAILGVQIDAEADGQPTGNADGDDLTNLDDEDGVVFTSALIRGQQATLNVTASAGCLLNAWMDFNQANGWADPGEQIFTNQPLIAGLNALTFPVPAGATLGPTYTRFRVNQNGNLGYTGQATDGEVEDYMDTIEEYIMPEYDFGDAPEGALAYPASGIPGQFPTCLNTGPSGWIQHGIFGAFFGPSADPEPEGNAGLCPLFNPNTYNQDECFGDGDAGLILPGAFTISGPVGAEIVVPCSASSSMPLGNTCTMAFWGPNIDIQVRNLMPAGGVAYVNVLMDWDQNGIWSGAAPCPLNPAPEHVLVNWPVPNGYIGPLSGLQPPPFLIGPFSGHVWARFSIVEIPAPMGWEGYGVLEAGETEDYLLLVTGEEPEELDFGDAPDVPYPTLQSNDGARHLKDGFTYLGSLVDAEADGQPAANADGDDMAVSDDEDGVVFTSPWIIGQNATVNVWLGPGNNMLNEDWSSADFTINNWSFDPSQNNWLINTGIGNPSPSVFYNWTPVQNNYSYSLVSKNLSGSGRPNVILQYDMYYWNYSSNTLEELDVEVWNGAVWISVANYTNANGDIPWITITHDISTLAIGHDFKVRFRVHGVTTMNIWYWCLDNIQIFSNVAGSAILNAWIDFNQTNGWADANEQIFINQPLVAGLNSLSFPVPGGATPGPAYARFRVNQNGGLSYTGLATDGEVEDYLDTIEEAPQPEYDFGDAPEGAMAYPASGLLGQFPTCITVGPPNSWIQHMNFGAFFGPQVDFEADGNAGLCPQFSNYNADECFQDGDAGLIVPGTFTIIGLPFTVVPCPGSPPVPLGNTCSMALWGPNIDIHVQNFMPSQSTGFVNVLIDWDQNGVWGGSSPCPGASPTPEHVLVNFPVPNGFNGPLSALQPPPFLIGPNSGYVWVRFSITEQPVFLPWNGSGMFEDGETEDYLLLLTEEEPEEMDFGDAPDGPYPTLLASDGARHTLNGFTYIGNLIDPEADGQSTPNADGDDLATTDDEDGIIFTSPLVPGQNATVDVTLGLGNASLLLNENWASADFTTNNWTFDPGQGNWMIDQDFGNPSPDAYFYYDPVVTNYSYALVSKNLSGLGMPNIILQYDIYYGNWSSATLEEFDVEVWDGNSWVSVANYDNSAGNIPWTTAVHDIGTLAIGHDFQVRFRAHGQNSFNIDSWDVDNISVFSQVTSSAILNAWLDFNQVNGWSDPGEQIFTNQLVVAGLNSLTFPVPANAIPGTTYSRFRINQNGSIGFSGYGYEGEVEDHPVLVSEEPSGYLDFGDAPEEALAYPGISAYGWFPTCQGSGNAGWIQHSNFGAFFGPLVDFEMEGNAGACPVFNPDNYDQDECKGGGDAGLIIPGAFTIVGPFGSEAVVPCMNDDQVPLGNTCSWATWGTNVDILVQNQMPGNSTGFVNILMDWDMNGMWGGGSPCPDIQNAPEHVLVNFPVPNGYIGPLSGLAPPMFLTGPFTGYVWVRFSITEMPVAIPWDGSGFFEDGETEDYLLKIGGEDIILKDFGDAPENALAYPDISAYGWFPTCMGSGNAGWIQHSNFGAFLGTTVDLEVDGNAGTCPVFNPNTYDQDECKGNGDAGLILPGAFTIAGPFGYETVVPCLPNENDTLPMGNTCTWISWGVEIDIHVQNLMPNGAIGYMNVLMDWDRNGTWTGSSPCTTNQTAPEHVLVNFLVPNGFIGPLSLLQPPGFLIGPNAGHVWVRFSITEQPVFLPWNGSGIFEDGETEDYLLLVNEEEPEEFDFGDAPDGPYPTLLASNGARHLMSGPAILGVQIDAEADGQPTGNADGDDLNNLDDEDGVVFTSALIRGQQATLNVTASAGCLLNAWMDFNQANGWGDPGEQIFTNQPLIAGLNALTFEVPDGATLGPTYVRFRVNQNGNLGYTGQATDGEVEDYTVQVTEENPVLPGDANCDGIVNVLDIITIVNYILGQNPDPFCFENADVNGDGNIDVLDIIGTVNIIFGG